MLRSTLQAALEVDAVPDYEQACMRSNCPFRSLRVWHSVAAIGTLLKRAVQRSHRWARNAQSLCPACPARR